jgi:hypothetical protein
MPTQDSALASFVRYGIIHSIMVANSIGHVMRRYFLLSSCWTTNIYSTYILCLMCSYSFRHGNKKEKYLTYYNMQVASSISLFWHRLRQDPALRRHHLATTCATNASSEAPRQVYVASHIHIFSY